MKIAAEVLNENDYEDCAYYFEQIVDYLSSGQKITTRKARHGTCIGCVMPRKKQIKEPVYKPPIWKQGLGLILCSIHPKIIHYMMSGKSQRGAS